MALVLAAGTNQCARSPATNQANEANDLGNGLDNSNTEENGFEENAADSANATKDSKRDKPEKNLADAEMNASDDPEKEDNTDALPHPTAPSKWRTQELLMMNTLPNASRIDDCIAEVNALADKALNQEMLVTSRNLLTQAIVRESEIYHWCFYTAVSRMDARTDAFDSTKTYAQRYEQFIGDMKALWIFSRALDTALHSHKYFGYLRRRYIEISGEYFGKPLTVISSPLGDKNRRVPHLEPKAATPEFDDY